MYVPIIDAPSVAGPGALSENLEFVVSVFGILPQKGSFPELLSLVGKTDGNEINWLKTPRLMIGFMVGGDA